MRSGLLVWTLVLAFGSVGMAQQQGLKAIDKEALRYHLDFLGASEFRGRETPSPELEIATLYIGNWLKHAGFKPLLPDRTYYQSFPIEVTTFVPERTRLTVTRHGSDERPFYPGRSFDGWFNQSGCYTGPLVFLGLGLEEPEGGKEGYDGIDIRGKGVIILDEQPPGFQYELGSTYSYRLYNRVAALRKLGAGAVFSIVPPERAAKQDRGEEIFADIPNGSMPIRYETQLKGARPTQTPPQSVDPFFCHLQIDHRVAAAMMGVDHSAISALFHSVRAGERLAARELSGVRVRFDLEIETRVKSTRNVLALVEGSDPKLKDEFIVVCAHHDHLGISDGEIIAGADDNGSGTVALMEIAQALLLEPPKRSVILAWFTGEERGYMGSHYFVNNSPVPVEKISACLNIDMVGRNGVDHLFLVGSDLLSTELDEAIHAVNNQTGLGFRFDYSYSNLTHPKRVYFRSDQYPHIRMGIPSVWFFCGFTPDYHTPWDALEAIDFEKLFRSTQLVYLTTHEVGNRPELLRLDVNPKVKRRGRHNLSEPSLYQNSR